MSFQSNATNISFMHTDVTQWRVYSFLKFMAFVRISRIGKTRVVYRYIDYRAEQHNKPPNSWA